MAKAENLYTLIDRQTGAAQIHDFLRPYKDINEVNKKEILIGGNKRELLEILSRAVSKNLIPRQDVIDFLREAEEHGQQHIFYFRPKTSAVRSRCKDYNAVVESLIGEEWDENFPLFDYIPDKYRWVDFRLGLTGKPQDWVFKAYGLEHQFRQTNVVRPDSISRIEYYAAEEVRVICLARWNNPDLLEIRIDSEKLTSIRAKEERLEKIWSLLAPAFQPADFVPWDLQTARSVMVAQRATGPDYTLSDLKLVDSDQGSMSIKPATAEEDIDALEARKQAIDILTADSATKCNASIIHWTIPPTGPVQDGQVEPKFTVICGGRSGHEIIVKARTTSRAIDYVTNRFRELSKPTP